jgi:hypothetical protein
MTKTGQDGSHLEAVESLILGFWRAELNRRRADLEQQSQMATDEQSREELMAQASLLTTDLKRLQNWGAGKAVLALYRDPIV